jgi:opacity protein-like surface antigen
MNVRKRDIGPVAALLVAGAVVLWPSRSEASIIDLGVAGGVLKRSLSDVDYNTSFAWQLQAEMTFFPFLMAGPYATFTSSSASIASNDTPSKIDFRTIGAHLKLKIPVTDSIAPFGVAGVGWAHADFPNQAVAVCNSMIPSCTVRLPSATANFAEFVVGGGIMWNVAGPLALTGEFDWRPTAGYTNDVYEQAKSQQMTTPPDPGRNGVAWVGLFGIALTL